MQLKSLVIAVATVFLGACASAPPAPQTINQTIHSQANLTTLSKAVDAAGLGETLSGPGPFTLFAPTDEAFAKVPKAKLDALLANKEALKGLLTYHVLPGKVTAAEAKNMKAKTVNGADASVSKSGDLVGYDDALVIQADIVATNGVIHVVDQVAMPPAKH
jgi:uncharacterized surface protein with fasciclin (FAS1) repeats